MKSHEAVVSIVEALKALYPDGLCSLQYPKPHELLFSFGPRPGTLWGPPG